MDIKIFEDGKLNITRTFKAKAKYHIGELVSEYGPKIDYWFRTSGHWPKENDL